MADLTPIEQLVLNHFHSQLEHVQTQFAQMYGVELIPTVPDEPNGPPRLSIGIAIRTDRSMQQRELPTVYRDEDTPPATSKRRKPRPREKSDQFSWKQATPHIVAAIAELGSECTKQEMAECLVSRSIVPAETIASPNFPSYLARMVKQGILERVGRGRYRIPSTSDTPETSRGDDADAHRPPENPDVDFITEESALEVGSDGRQFSAQDVHTEFAAQKREFGYKCKTPSPQEINTILISGRISRIGVLSRDQDPNKTQFRIRS